MVQNCGQQFDSWLEPMTASYHVLRYGVLTARGKAEGKIVRTGPCARTRDEKTKISDRDHSVVGSMASKWVQNPRRPRVELGERLAQKTDAANEGQQWHCGRMRMGGGDLSPAGPRN